MTARNVFLLLLNEFCINILSSDKWQLEGLLEGLKYNYVCAIARAPGERSI